MHLTAFIQRGNKKIIKMYPVSKKKLQDVLQEREGASSNKFKQF